MSDFYPVAHRDANVTLWRHKGREGKGNSSQVPQWEEVAGFGIGFDSFPEIKFFGRAKVQFTV